jgi:exodeoxyribonuclease VII small subunit
MTEPKFEKDLEKLEAIVEALEAGELSLDDALKKFEEGIKLYKRCERALSGAISKRNRLATKTKAKRNPKRQTTKAKQTVTAMNCRSNAPGPALNAQR